MYMMLVKKCIEFFLREEDGGLDEMIGMILGFSFLMFFVVPPATEFLITYLQAQEVEQVASTAASRACSLLSSHEFAQGQWSRQGGMGTLYLASEVNTKMRAVIEQTIINDTKASGTYRNSDGDLNYTLTLLDYLGNDITNGSPAFSRAGQYIGTSPSNHICPALSSGDSGLAPDWCLNVGNDTNQRIKAILRNQQNGMSQTDYENRAPASMNQEMFQSGRCLPGQEGCENWRKSLEGRLHKCIVQVAKRRQTIFGFAGIGAVKHMLTQILPTTIFKQSDATFRPSNPINVQQRANRLVLLNYENYEILHNEAGRAIDGDDLTKIEGGRYDSHSSVPDNFFEGDGGARWQELDRRVDMVHPEN